MEGLYALLKMLGKSHQVDGEIEYLRIVRGILWPAPKFSFYIWSTLDSYLHL